MNELTSSVSRTAAVAGRLGASQGAAPTAVAALPASADAVTLSAVAEEALRPEAPIDRARIDAIRAAIAGGDYPVDAAVIAESMLRLNLS